VPVNPACTPICVIARWARLPEPIVPYCGWPLFAFAAASSSGNVLCGCAVEWPVITIAPVATSITGARSAFVSNGRFGIRLGLTACVSNTTTKVWPSGGDFATKPVPIEPLPPARFSTITCWPSACDSGGANTRASRSVVPPGGNGETSRIGFDGHASACAKAGAGTARGSASASAVANAARPRRFD
jgi:hypothetical protein